MLSSHGLIKKKKIKQIAVNKRKKKKKVMHLFKTTAADGRPALPSG